MFKSFKTIKFIIKGRKLILMNHLSSLSVLYYFPAEIILILKLIIMLFIATLDIITTGNHASV